jgi:hypothetical protein
MRKRQCEKCQHYALYYMKDKTICANCQEIERSKVANSGVNVRS